MEGYAVAFEELTTRHSQVWSSAPSEQIAVNPHFHVHGEDMVVRRGRQLSWKPVRYAAVGGPNQVVSASTSAGWVRSPTQATYPSGRINTAVGAVTGPSAGSSHEPTYVASTS